MERPWKCVLPTKWQRLLDANKAIENFASSGDIGDLIGEFFRAFIDVVK